MYTKEEWQGAKDHHRQRPRCGACGAPLEKANPRTSAAAACSDPLCIACGVWSQDYRAEMESARAAR